MDSNKRAKKKQKTLFGRYCAELRLKLSLTTADQAKRMSYSQPYITQVENGTAPLTFEFLARFIKAFTDYEPHDVRHETQFQLAYEVISTLKTIELDLSKITIANHENLSRLMTAFFLNSAYPQTGNYGFLNWAHTNSVLDILAETPERIQYDMDRIIAKKELDI
jgi:transcriptional regulator with XRE-family HTH domain